MKVNKPPRIPIDGVFLLDKPIGITSNKALQKIKFLFRAQKAGHTGSLDPLASGVLPICFGKATKLSRFLLSAEKKYLVTAKFGVTTTTGDSDGEIISQSSAPKLTKNICDELINKFSGNIKQVPPMYSALKHQGTPLYKLARKGMTISRESRDVVIKDLKLIEQKDDSLTFSVSCSKGTYIRTLIEDMGDHLQCGAHVTMLRRTQAGHFSIEETTTIESLEEKLGTNDISEFILPLETIFSHWPKIEMTEGEALKLVQGKKEIIPSILDFAKNIDNNILFTDEHNNDNLNKWVSFTLKEKNKTLGVGEIGENGDIKNRIFCPGIVEYYIDNIKS